METQPCGSATSRGAPVAWRCDRVVRATPYRDRTGGGPRARLADARGPTAPGGGVPRVGHAAGRDAAHADADGRPDVRPDRLPGLALAALPVLADRRRRRRRAGQAVPGLGRRPRPPGTRRRVRRPRPGGVLPARRGADQLLRRAGQDGYARRPGRALRGTRCLAEPRVGVRVPIRQRPDPRPALARDHAGVRPAQHHAARVGADLMPEGDVVWRVSRQLDEALAGQALTRSDFRVPRFATTDLSGRVVREALSRGKHLLIRVDGGVTVHTHLRMDGSWRIWPAGRPAPRDHRVRLVLENARWQAVGYLLGVVEVVPTAREDRVVGHLGPDLLGPDWDAGEAVRRLSAAPDRPIGEALLDQANLAGIGNLYKSEVLFLRGISPWQPAGGAGALEPVVELARRLLEANKDRVGQVTTGNPARGEQTWVYGRSGRPCRRCGTAVLADGRAGRGAPAAERVTFWCPACQPGEAR